MLSEYLKSEAVFFPSCTNTTISFTDSATQCAVLLADSALLAQGQPGGNTVAGTAVIILLFYFFHNHISDFFSLNIQINNTILNNCCQSLKKDHAYHTLPSAQPQQST